MLTVTLIKLAKKEDALTHVRIADLPVESELSVEEFCMKPNVIVLLVLKEGQKFRVLL